jgi:hypothetical protein
MKLTQSSSLFRHLDLTEEEYNILGYSICYSLGRYAAHFTHHVTIGILHCYLPLARYVRNSLKSYHGIDGTRQYFECSGPARLDLTSDILLSSSYSAPCHQTIELGFSRF